MPQLLPEYSPLPLDYAQINFFELSNDSGYQKRIIFPDERVCHTTGVVSQHIASIRGLQNPCAVKEVHVKSEKVMVRCEMHKKKIIGP